MGDNVYVLEVLMRIRIDELHAAAARERLLAGGSLRGPRSHDARWPSPSA